MRSRRGSSTSSTASCEIAFWRKTQALTRPGMSTWGPKPGEKVKDVRFTDDLPIVDLADGRAISVTGKDMH
jgi:hypothetical protein